MEIYVLSPLWEMIMLFFLSIFSKYLGAETKERLIFLYSRQDLKPITTNIQGFFSRKNCIRMQNHKTKPEPHHSIEFKNTWRFHLSSSLHFIMSRVSRHLKSSLNSPWNDELSEVPVLWEWAEPDLGITRNIKNQFYEAMRLNVFLYIVTGCFLAVNISFNFLKRILKCK